VPQPRYAAHLYVSGRGLQAPSNDTCGFNVADESLLIRDSSSSAL
jgi:hypothetical protein